MNSRIWILPILIFGLTLNNCGSGSGTSSSSSSGGGTSSDTVTVSSLTSIPSTSEILSDSSSSSSISALISGAVIGTAPALQGITATSAETLFWAPGLIDTVKAGGVLAEADITSFWEGDGACRMTQNVGFSLAELQRVGTSICYMKSAPTAASGLTVVSGDLEDKSTVFNQGTETSTVKINITGEPSFGDSFIFIRVYGSGSTEGANGYAVDLWECATSSSSPAWLEQTTVNNATGIITQTSADQDEDGQFSISFTGTVETDADGNISFDSTATQEATVFFGGDAFNFASFLSVTAGSLVSKGRGEFSGEGATFTDKSYIVADYTGTGNSAAFTQGAAKVSWNDGSGFDDTFTNAYEFQTSQYVVNNANAHFATVNAFSFATDSFFSSTLAADATILAAISGYTCSVTPDIEVNMDMSDSVMAAIATSCEADFQDMNFCDSTNIQAARNAVFQQPQ